MNHLQKYELSKQAFEWNNPYDDWIPFNEHSQPQNSKQLEQLNRAEGRQLPAGAQRYSPSGASANPLNANMNDPYNDWIPFNEPDQGPQQRLHAKRRTTAAARGHAVAQRASAHGGGGAVATGNAVRAQPQQQSPFAAPDASIHTQQQPSLPSQPQTSNYRQAPAQLQQQQQQPTNTWTPKPLPTSRVAPSTNSGPYAGYGPDGNSYDQGLGGSKVPALAPTVTPKLTPPSTP